MWAGMSLVWAGRCHRCGHRDVTCADTEMSPVRAGRCHRCGRGDVTCASREMSPVRARSSLFSPSSLSPSSPAAARRSPGAGRGVRGGPGTARDSRALPRCLPAHGGSARPALPLSVCPASLRSHRRLSVLAPGPRSEPHPPGYSRPARPEEAGVQTVV